MVNYCRIPLRQMVWIALETYMFRISASLRPYSRPGGNMWCEKGKRQRQRQREKAFKCGCYEAWCQNKGGGRFRPPTTKIHNHSIKSEIKSKQKIARFFSGWGETWLAKRRKAKSVCSLPIPSWPHAFTVSVSLYLSFWPSSCLLVSLSVSLCPSLFLNLSLFLSVC